MGLKKYVMLVDRETGPLARLIPRLRELDFRIVLVPDPKAALEFVKAFPKLSMIAVNDNRDVERNPPAFFTRDTDATQVSFAWLRRSSWGTLRLGAGYAW